MANTGDHQIHEARRQSAKTFRTRKRLKNFQRCFVNATISKPIANEANRSWIFYDGECSFCIRQAVRFNRLLHKRGIELLPLQSAYARDLLRLADAELPNEMRLLTDDNRLLGGADALIALA